MGERGMGERGMEERGMGKRGVTGESGNYELLLIRNINHMYGGKKEQTKRKHYIGKWGNGEWGDRKLGNGEWGDGEWGE